MTREQWLRFAAAARAESRSLRVEARLLRAENARIRAELRPLRRSPWPPLPHDPPLFA